MTEASPRFLLCLSNDGYVGSLETRKVYQQVPDPDAASQDLVRVIDESGEDYLYPSSMFAVVELNEEAMGVLLSA